MNKNQSFSVLKSKYLNIGKNNKYASPINTQLFDALLEKVK